MALNLLDELNFSQSKPSLLYCDNQATINISENLVLYDYTSYVEVDCHNFIKKKNIRIKSSVCHSSHQKTRLQIFSQKQ